jgi:SMC interacting uncharacterized protein involved in chromosome segregation
MDGDADFDEFGGKMEAVNDPAHAEKIFFEYLSKAYAVFLAGDDNYDAMDSELITSFGSFLSVDTTALRRTTDFIAYLRL